MTLKQKFENVDILFESQLLKLKYDENMDCADNCEQIANEYAIEFSQWVLDRFTFKDYIHKELSELLEIFKKEKGL